MKKEEYSSEGKKKWKREEKSRNIESARLVLDVENMKYKVQTL